MKMIDWAKIRAIEDRGAPYSATEAATILYVTPAWLNRRMRDGLLVPKKGASKYELTESDIELLRGSPVYARVLSRRTTSYNQPYVPHSLRQYHRYHATINEFTWLLKAYYSGRDDLKRRRFRLDTLFQQFIASNEIHPDRIRESLGSQLTSRQVRDAAASVQRVWYNEMAYHQPPLSHPFLLDSAGVSKNLHDSSSRYMFPSWRISTAYYCVYHAFRSLCDSLAVQYRREEHNSPFRAFKATKLNPSLREFLAFPFNLRHGPSMVRGRRNTKLLPQELPILRFGYASHPRPPKRSYRETLDRVVKELGHRWRGWPKGMQHQDYMIPDLLLQFRNWVNYVDVDNMIALKSEGFRAYLDQDLATIIWFYAAFAELVAIAQLGTATFLNVARRFWDGFVSGDDALWRRDHLWPMDARLRVYVHMGLLPGSSWSPRYPALQAGATLELL